jgi:hypothetical protein
LRAGFEAPMRRDGGERGANRKRNGGGKDCQPPEFIGPLRLTTTRRATTFENVYACLVRQ